MFNAPVTYSSQIVYATNGDVVYPDSWAQTLSYSSGNLSSITIVNPSDNSQYVQTLTYSSGQLSNVSGWVKQ